MEGLGIYHMNGEMGLERDLAKAEEMFRKAGKHGCASAFGKLGVLDTKKAKHYWELAAVGGDINSRYALACLEGRTGNETRASKHYLICAKAGCEASLIEVKNCFKKGYIAKDQYSEALRAYQKQCDDIKSAMRDEALVYEANPSLYFSDS